MSKEKSSNLKARTITAFIFVPVVLLGLFGGAIAFSILFLIVLVTCSVEYYTLIFKKEEESYLFRRNYGVFLSCFIYFTVATNHLCDTVVRLGTETLLMALIPLSFIAFVYELFKQSPKPFHSIALVTSGILYIGVPMFLVQYLAFGVHHEYNPQIVIGLIVMNWLNDTGAYLAGSKFGKTPLFPKVSPNKTWEGTLGGIALCMITGYLFSLNYDVVGTLDWFILSIIVAIFGVLGDLVESMLKRSLGVKDSGRFLPGHGGMLDRFDAFLFVLPFAATYVYFVNYFN